MTSELFHRKRHITQNDTLPILSHMTGCTSRHSSPVPLPPLPLDALTCQKNHTPANKVAVNQIKDPSKFAIRFTSTEGDYWLQNACVCVLCAKRGKERAVVTASTTNTTNSCCIIVSLPCVTTCVRSMVTLQLARQRETMNVLDLVVPTVLPSKYHLM